MNIYLWLVSVLTKVHLSRYEGHYALPLGRKKGAKLTDAEEAVLNKKRSKKCEKVYKERQKDAKVEQGLTDQFMTGKKLKHSSWYFFTLDEISKNCNDSNKKMNLYSWF